MKKLNKEESIKEFNNSVTLAKNLQDKYNAFVTICEEYNHIESDTLIDGVPYALKDNFSTSGILTTGGSNILSDYVPVFDSTVYKKLKNAGGVLVGKTCLDELAMGGTGTTGFTGIQKNPWDLTRMVGGSSSGSAIAVSTGIVPFAIGSDTGDSIRKPASYTGIVGFKPTYGRISRFGLFPYASSLDTVGIMARNVEDVSIVTDILKGQDELDMTTLEDENYNYTDKLNDSIKGKKLFYISSIADKDSFDKIDSDYEKVLDNFNETIEKIKSLDVTIDKIDFRKDLLQAIYATYFTISCAETTSNNANLTGFLYGLNSEENNVNDRMIESRTKGFSELIKRRFVIGSYVLGREQKDRLFNNALRVRRMIIEEMNHLFEKYDAMILPSSNIAPKFSENPDTLKDEYLIADNHLQIGNFGGYPSICIPSGFVNNMPTSINITGKVFDDASVLNIAAQIENILPYKDMRSGEVR